MILVSKIKLQMIIIYTMLLRMKLFKKSFNQVLSFCMEEKRGSGRQKD